jgi:hypothetical protein
MPSGQAKFLGIPDSRLLQKSSDMSRGLNNFEESRQEIETILARCESTLRNLLPKLSGVERRTTKRLTKSIRSYRHSSWWHSKKTLDLEYAWVIYNDLQGLIESVQNLEEDIRWR